MWKSIKNNEYFLLFAQDKGYEICVTDYVAIWTTYYSKKAFIAQLKESNEGLELVSDDDYLEKGLYLLSNLDQLKKINIRKEDNGKNLFLSMRIICGYPFCFECKLSKGSEELYFEKITRLLLKTVGDLRSSQSELRRLLIKKDEEIAEYKSQNGEIEFRYLKTAAFNDEEHMKKFKTYEENFGTTEMVASLIEKSVELPRRNIIPESTANVLSIKQEPNIIKQESSILKQESSSIKQESSSTKQESSSIKQEPHTPILEEPTLPLASSSVSCKQEVIKTESQTRQTSNPRKRLRKLNY